MSTALHLAVPCALGAAACFGYAAAVQHDESGQVERRAALDPGLLGALARRGRWWFGIAADVLAVLLQLVALRYGPVALVQPLLVAGLPAAVLLSCWMQHRGLQSRELVGVGICAAGIALIAIVTRDADLSVPIERSAAVVASAVTTVVLLLLLALARARPAVAGALTGAAAGIATGAGSVLLAVCAARIDDPLHLLGGIVPYAAVVVGLLGLLLTQAAFQTGALATPLATLSLVEPATAVLLAAAVLRQHLPGSGPAVLAVATGAVLSVVGVVILAPTASAADVTAHSR
jgi:uncharacterized membrane protein